MLQPTKYKEFIAIIKSGLVGALALTGIYIILAITSLFVSVWIPLIAAVFFIAVARPEAVFVVTCSIGFMLGLLLRRRYATIQRGLPLVIALVMVVVPLGYGMWLVNKMWMNTELPPLSLKLADCTNNVVNIHLEIPAGHDYRLDLNTPETQVLTNEGTSSSYNFSGHLRISRNGALIADLPIGSDKAWRNGSWYGLTGVGMQNTNVPPLSKFLQAHKSYDFEINFEPPPPPASSIWLYCLESVKDRDK